MVAGVCKSKRRIDGQVAIVTGANSGKCNTSMAVAVSLISTYFNTVLYFLTI